MDGRAKYNMIMEDFKISFIVYGVPTAKGRPRLGKWGTYTPDKTVRYEELVKFSYLQSEQPRFMNNEALFMYLTIYMPIPKSTSKKLAELMREGIIRPTKKPDIDNFCKSIMDALNGVAYADDSQIVSLHVQKFYSDQPRAEVDIHSNK